ncbi:MAG TPA: flagellar basal-body rod protein FlgF [Devosia sp.]|nr:flagellar basal-body rod protein FlgF [Devosia sp.]
MENAQLIALSRQIALKRQMSVVANNVANVNTTGFKAESMLFEEYVMPVAKFGEYSKANQTLSYTQDWVTVADFTAGDIAPTGNELDIALRGNGFLTVETPQGERWTRAGALQLDNSGTLVNASGFPVLSEGGQIRFGAGETDIRFNEDGSITSSAGAKGTLRLVEFENMQELAREGGNLFSGGQPLPSPLTRVVQGAIERSNVSGVTEIAEMIRVNRSYQSIAQLIKRQDELRRDAIKTLGSLTS